MLTERQFHQIRGELSSAKNPLYFFDDDADGLSSFLLLYRFCKEGHGVVIKARPKLDISYLRKVEEYQPDKIFVLDKPMVAEEFVEGAKAKIIWIDHHEPQNMENVLYFNPRVENRNDSHPTSYLCYKAVNQDMWIAMAGCVADWFLPDFTDDFKKEYPDLLPKEIKKAEDALFKTRIGELARIFSFMLRGKTSDVMGSIKILTRTESPYEILEQATQQGKYIYDRFQKIKKEYDRLLDDSSKEGEKNDKLLSYIYTEKDTSFTGDLSNELIYRFPNKLVVVGREKADEVKMSLRSSALLLPPIIENSLKGLDGYGGGHEHACGACVKKHDFKKFIDNLRREAKF